MIAVAATVSEKDAEKEEATRSASTYSLLSQGFAGADGDQSAADPTAASEKSTCCRRYEELQDEVRFLLEDPDSSRCASFVHYAGVIIIILSTFLAIIQTVPEFADKYAEEFDFLEMAFTGSFSLEILLRLWTATTCAVYISQASNVVDIFATLPWYLEQGLHRAAVGSDMSRITGSFRTLRMVRLVRMVRLLRVLRLAKAARHSETISTVFESIWDSLEGILIMAFLVGLGAILSATVVYAIESEDDGAKFRSIPSAMWWSMATITTVGYGDVVPATVAGKAVACATMVVGMIIVSVSVASITTSFTESYNRRMAAVKIAKSIRKARAASVHWGADEEASPSNSPDRCSFATSARHSMTEKSQMDLISMLSALEADTKRAMTLLDTTIQEVVQASQLTAENGLGPKRKSVPSIRPTVRISESELAGASVALTVLRAQSTAFFKSALGIAGQVVDAQERQKAARRG